MLKTIPNIWESMASLPFSPHPQTCWTTMLREVTPRLRLKPLTSSRTGTFTWRRGHFLQRSGGWISWRTWDNWGEDLFIILLSPQKQNLQPSPISLFQFGFIGLFATMIPNMNSIFETRNSGVSTFTLEFYNVLQGQIWQNRQVRISEGIFEHFMLW